MKELGRSSHSIVWKGWNNKHLIKFRIQYFQFCVVSNTFYHGIGIYNDKIDVAVKFFLKEVLMNNEINAFKALNAIDDETIESHHIPRVYYYGKLNGNLYAIAMSLFDGTLVDYYIKPQKKHLSHLDIIYIFMQTVCEN